MRETCDLPAGDPLGLVLDLRDRASIDGGQPAT
jgi:hypothetical protein